MQRLADKVAIITGGGSGIGRSIAIAFAAEGADICVVGRTLSKLEETAREAEKLGHRVLTLQVDVTKAAELKAMATRTFEHFGQIDVLVNNAGGPPMLSALSVTEAQWDGEISVNLRAVFFGAQSVLPYMIKQGSGKIINISATTGFIAKGLYASGKGGVPALTRALAMEFAAQNINVNCVGPGLIVSELNATVDTSRFSDIPMGRTGRGNEVAAAALYLASSDSDFVTGQMFCVDGGLSAK